MLLVESREGANGARKGRSGREGAPAVLTRVCTTTCRKPPGYHDVLNHIAADARNEPSRCSIHHTILTISMTCAIPPITFMIEDFVRNCIKWH